MYDSEIQALIDAEHAMPHRILGAHPASRDGKEGLFVRALHPEASGVECLVLRGEKVGQCIPLARIHPGGLFEAFLPDACLPIQYRLRFSFPNQTTSENYDPYNFSPTLGDQDLHYFAEGSHRELWKALGAHPRVENRIAGVAFSVWAPNAKRVSVVGDFCHWDGRLFAMRCLENSGVFEIFIPGLTIGSLYKFEIKTKDGRILLKADPFARSTELPPGTASRIEHSTYQWNDGDWLARRRNREPRRAPMAAYEVHLGSWARIPEEGNRSLSYREIAPRLIAHLERLHFTHVQFMPLSAHPFDGSWGYQVTGYYAATPRFGSPDDLRFLIDQLHQHGIGVILDWVPAHFPKDDFALAGFDGTCLFEHAEPNRGEHPDWGTLIFNYGRNEVRNFLIASALYWIREFHFDGLRVDAVASMLYLDYSRGEGQWSPNQYGGRENLEAVDFLKQMNRILAEETPGCITIAEESTSWAGVTKPPEFGGLGFTFKWNMGWMHDTLLYFSRDPIYRKYHQNDLTFSMVYEYSEYFLMPLSHDEVVHGKRSLFEKMPGDDWQRFANLRLLLSYQYTRPGKKLLFMGTELAPYDEWNSDVSLPWHLGQDPMRQAFARFLEKLGALYVQSPCLWEMDADPSGFEWIDFGDHQNSVMSYRRRTAGSELLIVLNFTPTPHSSYRIGTPQAGKYLERFNSDAHIFGGSGFASKAELESETVPAHGHPQSVCVSLPPLGALVLEYAENPMRIQNLRPKLQALAQRCGIASGYEGAEGQWHITSDATREALLSAMGFDASDEEHAGMALQALEETEKQRLLDPVCVIRKSSPSLGQLSLRLPEKTRNDSLDWQLEFVHENGLIRQIQGTSHPIHGRLFISIPDPDHLDPGYHTVLWHGKSTTGDAYETEQRYIVVPDRCVTPSDLVGNRRIFGLSTNLYSLRGERNWGVGDLTDLSQLLRQAGGIGAGFVGINPIHTVRNQGLEISPYFPVSRLYRNLIYLDIDVIPEMEQSQQAQTLLRSPAFIEELRRVRDDPQIDYPSICSLKERVLGLLFEVFETQSEKDERKQAFRAYAEREAEDLQNYSTYLALQAHFDKGSSDTSGTKAWPAGYERPDTPAVQVFRAEHAREIEFHKYVQFELDRQLESATAQGRRAGLEVGLIHDLAIGSDPSGSDSWCFPALFVRGATIGAPPDPLAEQGQDWSLAPLDPRRLREDGYRFWTKLLRHAFRCGGGLRIDHAMALERLYWIPKDHAVPGTYIRYPAEELFGILALESWRANAVVVAEDLGTIPSGFREELEAWGAQRTHVLYFERDRDGTFCGPERYSAHAFTTANTHDLPTLRGFLTASDLELRRRLGVFSEHEWELASAERREALRQLEAALVGGGWLNDTPSREPRALCASIIAFLTATPSALLAIALDDFGLEREAINLPGVSMKVHPSWSRRMSQPLAELLESPFALALLHKLEPRGARLHSGNR